MRIAALYDIHGNLPALEAVLNEVSRSNVDLIVVGGDVMPGPMPRESLELLLSVETPIRFIRGNGDRETVAPTGAVPEQFQKVLAWNAEQLDENLRGVVSSWPATLRVDTPALGTVLFCHATPHSDTDIFTAHTPAELLEPMFDAAGASLVVCGHTHMQFDRTIGKTRVINAGSVGMPFGTRGAYWAELDTEVRLRHTVYGFEQAAARIRTSGDPNAEHFAQHNVLEPPSSESMLAAFNAPRAPEARSG